MIYQIYNVDVVSAVETGLIICWSTDGEYALVSAEELSTSIEIIDQFNEADLSAILKLPLWQQPCPSC